MKLRTNCNTLPGRSGQQRLRLIACFLATIVFAGSTAHAEDDIALPAAVSEKEGLAAYPALPAVLTLEDAVRLFRKRAYNLIIADASVLDAKGNLQSAGQFANPSVNITAGHSIGYNAYSPKGPGGGASPYYYGASLSDNGLIIDALLVHKRLLRVDAAQAALDSAQYSRTDTERTLVSLFKQQWVAVAAQRKQLVVSRDLLESNKKTEALILTRFNAGAASMVELAMQKTASYESAQQVAYAEAAYLLAKAQLAFYLGERGQAAQFEVDANLFDRQLSDDVLRVTPASLRQVAEGHRPDVLAQRAEVSRAQATLALTQRQVIPDFQLNAAYSQQGTGDNAANPPTWTVGLTIIPPLFYRLEGELTMARSDLRTQQATLAQTEAQVASDIDTAHAAFASARDRLDRLNHGYLEQSKLQFDLTRVQYEKGAASLVDLLFAQRTYIATVSEWVQSLNDFWTAIFTIEAAVAKEFKV